MDTGISCQTSVVVHASSIKNSAQRGGEQTTKSSTTERTRRFRERKKNEVEELEREVKKLRKLGEEAERKISMVEISKTEQHHFYEKIIADQKREIEEMNKKIELYIRENQKLLDGVYGINRDSKSRISLGVQCSYDSLDSTIASSSESINCSSLKT